MRTGLQLTWARAVRLSIRWNDEELRVGWPVKEPILSEKDAEAPSLETIIEKVYAMTPSVR